MLGLTLYSVGALLFWPAAIKRSFGGFCGATFVIDRVLVLWRLLQIRI